MHQGIWRENSHENSKRPTRDKHAQSLQCPTSWPFHLEWERLGCFWGEHEWRSSKVPPERKCLSSFYGMVGVSKDLSSAVRETRNGSQMQGEIPAWTCGWFRLGERFWGSHRVGLQCRLQNTKPHPKTPPTNKKTPLHPYWLFVISALTWQWQTSTQRLLPRKKQTTNQAATLLAAAGQCLLPLVRVDLRFAPQSGLLGTNCPGIPRAGLHQPRFGQTPSQIWPRFGLSLASIWPQFGLSLALVWPRLGLQFGL